MYRKRGIEMCIASYDDKDDFSFEFRRKIVCSTRAGREKYEERKREENERQKRWKWTIDIRMETCV